MRRDKRRNNNNALTRSSKGVNDSLLERRSNRHVIFVRLKLLCGEGFHCTYIAEGFSSVTVGYGKGVVYLSVEVLRPRRVHLRDGVNHPPTAVPIAVGYGKGVVYLSVEVM